LASMHKLRRLWVNLGLAGPVYRSLWKVLGLWRDGAESERAA